MGLCLSTLNWDHPLKHRTSLGVGSHNTTPLGLASITSDPWQTTLESNVGFIVMNIDEVDSLQSNCKTKYKLKKMTSVEVWVARVYITCFQSLNKRVTQNNCA